MLIDMSDYIPEYITNPDYGWAYCPHCNYPPSYRPHHAVKIDGRYCNVHSCDCGAIREVMGWRQIFISHREKEPWYIKRKWRVQRQGRKVVFEYLQGCFIGRYPISQHIEDMLTHMPLDWKVRLPYDVDTAITEEIREREAGQ